MRRVLVPVLLLLAGVAHAADPLEEPTGLPPIARKWHLGLEAMTDFPLTVGVQVWAELPYRIRLSTSVGELPDAYLQTINAIAVAAGVYNQSQANFLTELIDRATTWRFHVGWRPFKNRGAYFEVGPGIITIDKSLALGPVIELATGFPVPQEASVGFGYSVHTVVETFGGEVGWVWYPWRGLTLRVSLAFAAAVGAQVDITPNFASTIQQPFTRFAEAYAEDFIKKYFLIPTVGFAVGWKLF
jgi:hypothetical protein